MARRNEYTYSKRQRELKKRKKIEEKRQKKLARKGLLEDGETPIEGADGSEAPPDGTAEGMTEPTAETAPDQEPREDPRPDAEEPTS